MVEQSPMEGRLGTKDDGQKFFLLVVEEKQPKKESWMESRKGQKSGQEQDQDQEQDQEQEQGWGEKDTTTVSIEIAPEFSPWLHYRCRCAFSLFIR